MLRRIALVVVLLLSITRPALIASPLLRQSLMLGIGGAGTVATPTIAIVQGPTAFDNTASATSYAITVPATAAGSVGLILQSDVLTATSATVPTSSGSTWTAACQFTSGNAFGAFTSPLATGTTSITVHPGASSKTTIYYLELSGVNTTTPKDACVSAVITIANTRWSSNPLSASQSVAAIGWTWNRAVGNSNYVVTDAWHSPGKDFPESGDGDDHFASYILNGYGQFTWEATGDSHNQISGLLLLKAATAGSAPSGNLPTMHLDFENSTNGTTLTNAILLASTHGGGCNTWALSNAGAGLTISTTGQQTSGTQVTTNGATRTDLAGTRGVAYDTSQTPVTSASCVFPTATSTASMGSWVKTPASNVAGKFHDFFTINGGGSDRAQPQIKDDSTIVLECQSGDSTAVSISLSTWYFIAVQYVAGGTHTMKIYDTSLAQVGATKTCAATGTNNATAVSFGDDHAGGAASTGTYYFDNIVVDYLNGTMPTP